MASQKRAGKHPKKWVSTNSTTFRLIGAKGEWKMGLEREGDCPTKKKLQKKKQNQKTDFCVKYEKNIVSPSMTLMSLSSTLLSL
jgi:hypothetical protein